MLSNGKVKHPLDKSYRFFVAAWQSWFYHVRVKVWSERSILLAQVILAIISNKSVWLRLARTITPQRNPKGGGPCAPRVPKGKWMIQSPWNTDFRRTWKIFKHTRTEHGRSPSPDLTDLFPLKKKFTLFLSLNLNESVKSVGAKYVFFFRKTISPRILVTSW